MEGTGEREREEEEEEDGKQHRTDREKCTHQYDETQGNNNTQALSIKFVFFGCKTIDNKRTRK